MPLPLIPVALVAGAAALFGLGKTAGAIMDSNKADDLGREAQDMIEESKYDLEKAREKCADSLQKLGSKKIAVLEETLKGFVEHFEKLKEVKLQDSVGLDELGKLAIDEETLKEIKLDVMMVSSLLGGAGGGLGAGALTAFGAYNATMALGAAGTGTAIGSLSGVAATNATLAWLGGGTLAAGGMGVAGGMMVLGGLVAAPALAILGAVLGSAAEKKLDEAKAKYAQAETIVEELKNMRIMTQAIGERAEMFHDLLAKLDLKLYPLVDQLGKIIAKEGVYYSRFTQESRELVAKATSLAVAIKAVLDTPLLDKEGGLTQASKELLGNNSEELEEAEIKRIASLARRNPEDSH